MKTLDLIQGSPEWLAHRALHFNASDAPAMLGCSPYMTRTQLLQQLHSGVTAEVDAATQRRFDAGHRFEALARPLAEEIIGEDLYPCTGVDGELSASFDGLTMDESTGFEHKTLNDQLKAALMSDAGADALPKAYRVQMEQQCAVSGATRILFMASKWDGDRLVEEMHAWYEPDLELRAEIMAGWKQFAEDLANYAPAATAVAVVAEPVQALPAVTVLVEGAIVIRDNFAAFETALRDFLEHRLIREPKTDQDFADLDLQIKAMKGAEAALDAAESQMLAQIQTVDTAKKTKDMLSRLVRDNRLMAEKLLASEKERRRGEIVAAGVKAMADHVAALNARLGKPYMPPAVPTDFGGVIKGKKSLASMEEAVATELARAKIAANEIADRIQANLAILREKAAAHSFLFPDTGLIVHKATDDLATLVTARIAEHEEKERARQEAERERIRQEERQRAEAEQQRIMREQHAEQDRLAREEAQRLAEAAKRAEPPPAAAAPAPAAAPTPAPAVIQMPARAAAAPATAPSLSLGQISTRLGFTVTAAFLTGLGFAPAGRERAAVLYHEADFGHICAALVAHVQAIQAKQAA